MTDAVWQFCRSHAEPSPVPAPYHCWPPLAYWATPFLASRWPVGVLFWISPPIVSLGSFVISTDSILLCRVMALLIPRSQGTGQAVLSLCLGLVIGIGLLPTAAIYFVVGAVSHSCSSETTSSMKLRWITLIAGALISFSPNLIWNFANGGITFCIRGKC